MKRALLVLALVACGGAPPPPPEPPAPTPQPKAVEPPPVETPKEPEPEPAPAPEPAEAKPEPCEEPWICLSVSLDTKKVEKRATKLLGDPKIDETWSRNVDSTKTGAFEIAGRTVEVALKNLPGDKSQVVLRTGKGAPEIVLDTHQGMDYVYVGVIAAAKDNALLVDFLYAK